MVFSLFDAADTEELLALFTQVFTASEGSEEGQNLAKLVADLLAHTSAEDLIGFTAKQQGRVLGGIFFSRFTVPSGQLAYILSPVAVATECQGRGIGQQLIAFGLDALKARQVELVFTYGDPAFYTKTGFQPITEQLVKAPYPLSQPIGWLAQSLTGTAIAPMHGETKCVAALSDPKYW